MTAPPERPATRIEVATRPAYEVVVGADLWGELGTLVGADAARVAVVHPTALGETATTAAKTLERAGHEVLPVEVPDGEQAKTLAVAGQVWAALGRAGFTRSDVVVSVGGGAATDLAGFVAATWLRGVRVVHVPTTLLGMVDAAIGGKTAIDTAEGKNLVGAFHQPAGVLCDLSTLANLPQREYVSGLAEVVKAGFIADPVILDLLEADLDGARTPSGPHTREVVERAVRVKAVVVADDPTERTLRGVGREALNYGHTLGHAIEKVEAYTWRHGDAVSVGLVFAAELSRLSGRMPRERADAVVDRHRTLLGGLGLPVTYERKAWPALREAMRVDKKARGDRLRFVVLTGLGGTAVLDAPSEQMLYEAYMRVSAEEGRG